MANLICYNEFQNPLQRIKIVIRYLKKSFNEFLELNLK